MLNKIAEDLTKELEIPILPAGLAAWLPIGSDEAPWDYGHIYKCECGSASLGSDRHSTYCPLHHKD